MNNKIVKRFAAVALGAAVLSTCAFASTITSADYAKADATLTYAISSTADKISYIAYAATKVADGTEGATVVDGTSYTLGEIVAVNQIDDNTTGGSNGTVSIDSAKLTGATHVVLMSGDSNGELGKVAMAIDDFAIATAIKNTGKFEVKIGDKTYTDCPNFKVDVTANKGGTLTVTGLKKVVNGVETAIESTKITGTLPTGISITAGSSYTIENIYVVGMSAEDLANISNIRIEPIVTLN